MIPYPRKRPPHAGTKLKVLVAAVTAAERGEPMPTVAELKDRIGCVEHGVSMALLDLERRGVIERIGTRGGRLRVLIKDTGAATAEV
mgnify:CR=1 FL=1